MMNLWQRCRHWLWHVRTYVPEFWNWGGAALVLLALIWWKQPQQIPVLAYMLCRFCAAVYFAHVIDVRFFKPSEEEPRDVVHAAKEIARALVYIGTVFALTLGV